MKGVGERHRGGKAKSTMQIDADLLDELTQVAKERGIVRSELIRRLLSLGIDALALAKSPHTSYGWTDGYAEAFERDHERPDTISR